MPEFLIPDEARAEIQRLAPAALVFALPQSGPLSLPAAIDLAHTALLSLPPTVNAALLHSTGAVTPTPSDRLRLLDLSWTAAGSPAAFLAAARVLDAQTCVVIGSDPAALTPAHLAAFIEPVFGGSFDLAAARYPRRRFDSLINSGIVYPLLRALYGKRVEWPMAPDFAASRRLVDRYLASSNGASPGWIAATALAAGFEICQANLPSRPEPAQPPADVAAALAQVLGPIFVDMERNAALWQRIRGSRPIDTFGPESPAAGEAAGFDAGRLIETFQLGFRNLQEIWNLVLTPATLLGLKKLTRLAPADFRMPGELWARVIFDFAIAWRMRVMNRDHLLRALTPVYLGWVASHALDDNPGAVELLCRAYESEKPYIQSRWRWPDRFNP